ncbi:DUF1934 domain-containing protein [Streptococcus sp. DD04]|uniref:DUF1934 domain-containing protein n=1 Tax=Streptococcus sp. DD04 TaxID=1776578 RepID=UPI0007860D1E|nr:DUF1934 domain-containing protein [Streptococcus sp. DD04]
MKIRMRNQIKLDDQIELIDQIYDVEWTQKGDYHYLLYKNEEKEKVVLKFNADKLTMTRFSKPKSILSFVKDSQHFVAIPTPLGAQHFLTDTQHYHLDVENQALELHYDLKRADDDQLFASYQMKIEWKEEKIEN